jgi:hypothetical protein
MNLKQTLQKTYNPRSYSVKVKAGDTKQVKWQWGVDSDDDYPVEEEDGEYEGVESKSSGFSDSEKILMKSILKRISKLEPSSVSSNIDINDGYAKGIDHVLVIIKEELEKRKNEFTGNESSNIWNWRG